MSGEVRAKTKHGEMTIDQLAEIQPGMAKIMQEIANDYSTAYYAAKGGNWKLAAHELSLVRVGFRTAKVTRPKYTQDLDEFDARYLVPILKAIQQKDWTAAEAAFEKGTQGSDEYHDKYGYDYIRFVLPGEPPAYLHLGPTEGFNRRPKGGVAPS
ncbi:MAG: hypothetical protein OK438_08640 [Thaumarchaeota archaeon]|nr:hypothetical protein [Nitrososphaerota archaeon]